WEGEADARRFLALLFDEPGRVVELRVPKPKTKRWAAAGYFGDPDRILSAAAQGDGRAEGIYVTLNPVNVALLARAANVVKCPIEATTADADVVARRWLLVDLDPSRPKGVSSSEAEHGAALARAGEVRAALTALGWPEPVHGDSGNGAHLLYRIDLPRDDGGLVKRVLDGLAFRFGDAAVGVDTAVFNAARISKLYGTIAAKGDSTPERPHRRSRLLSVPGDLRVVPPGLLESIAASVPRPRPPARSMGGAHEPIDVEAFVTRHALEVARESDWHGGHRWILRTCPWQPSHTDRSAYIVQFASGAVAAGCLHASCAGKKWRDLRTLLEPAGVGSPRARVASPPAAETAPGSPVDGRPMFIAGDELQDLVPAVWAPVLKANDPPRLFVRATQLTQIRFPMASTPYLDPLTVDDAHGIVFRAGAWRRETEKGEVRPAHPPKDIARDFLSRPHADLPWIEAIVTAPVFDRDWRLVAEEGFNHEAGLYLHLDGLALPPVPERPSEADVRAAVGVLEDIVHDFPFVKPSDRAHALAAFFLPFVRRAIGGATPLHEIEAPVPGTGKSLLADLVSRVSTGSGLAATTMPRDEDELRKKITAVLVAGKGIICFDNVTSLAFGTLAAAVTADPWADRLLGKSQELVLPNRALWLATSNNPKLTTEIARRCVRIRIDPRMERPWERREFRHPDIRGHVDANRGAIIAAILTVVRGWLVAGAPRGTTRLGSFETWSEVLGGILAFAGIDGFLDDRDELFARADEEDGEWHPFVIAWNAKVNDFPRKPVELAQFCEREGLLETFLAAPQEKQGAKAMRLGRALRAREGRIYEGFRIVRIEDKHTKMTYWCLEDAGAGASSRP
ncbi:MAG TPA: hypothetical protein VHF22_06730, partial [Planctomycetota bacterium]|nr:hypothetical protein [Planctomycetota bacterium]